MKRKIILLILLSGLLLITSITYYGCRSARIPVEYAIDTIYTNQQGEGELLEIHFRKGSEHNHPLLAIWIEDTSGNYIQTLYVAESIAKGVFGHGDKSTGKWLPGPIRRPAALPYWSHSRGVKESDGLFIPTQETAIPDAYTGATPQAHFVLLTRADKELPNAFYILFEINQSWDWNDFWTNSKYPDDEDYKASCQPALIYKTLITENENNSLRKLELVGHSHYNGKKGEMYTDLSTITTAREITESIYVKWVN